MTTPDMNTAEAEGWRPESGDVLVGTVEDIDIGWSDFRGEYPILTIRAGEGTASVGVARSHPGVNPGDVVKVHCFHDVLFSRVTTLRPVPGETVGIQFHGKHPHKTKPSQTVSRYTLRVQGRGADAAGLYDRLGGGRTRPPAQQQQPPQPRGERPPVDTRDFEPAQGALPDTSEDDDIPF